LNSARPLSRSAVCAMFPVFGFHRRRGYRAVTVLTGYAAMSRRSVSLLGGNDGCRGKRGKPNCRFPTERFPPPAWKSRRFPHFAQETATALPLWGRPNQTTPSEPDAAESPEPGSRRGDAGPCRAPQRRDCRGHWACPLKGAPPASSPDRFQ
jgi:hypothetical protein